MFEAADDLKLLDWSFEHLCEDSFFCIFLIELFRG